MSVRIGRYEIIDEIGSGGFATVFRATDPKLQREVAIKVMRPVLMSDRSFVTRFEQEARTIANLEHPNIIPIYDYGEFDGRLFLVMKMMSNSLGKFLTGKPIPWRQVIGYMNQVGAGLDYAHAHGLVHRDIKPENILIDDKTGVATISDFGIVKALESSTVSMSMTGGILGTPAYMPPEVWNGQTVTSATDTYALACVVYEMVLGQKLFEGPTPPATMAAHFKPLDLPGQWPEKIPQDVGDVLTKALSKEPAGRYSSTGAFVTALTGLSLDSYSGEYNKLQTAMTAEKWTEAISVAEGILTKDPHYRNVAELLNRAMEAQTAEEQAGRVAQWQEQAETALSSGEWKTAQIAIQRWQQIAPDDPAARVAMEKAEAGFVESRKADQVSEWRQKTEEAIAAGDWVGAETAALQWQALAPDDTAVNTTMEKVRAGKAQTEKEAEVTSWREKTEQAVAAGNWAEAQAACLKWQRLVPNDAEARKVMERILAGKADAEKTAEAERLRKEAKDAMASGNWTIVEQAAIRSRQLALEGTTDQEEKQVIETVDKPLVFQPKAKPGDVRAKPKVEKTPTSKEKTAMPIWVWAIVGVVILVLAGFGIRSLFNNEPETPEVVEVTRVVTETEVVEVESTREVVVVEEVEVPVDVTPVEEEESAFEDTPLVEEVLQEPEKEALFKSPDNTTYIEQVTSDIRTMDPNMAYDTASYPLIENVMEGLIWYDHNDATSYIPILAEEIPSVANGLISEDGLSYTFNIRDGVSFHDGGSLEPHDVAYTFQRGLLQSDCNSPQWLLIDPLMGYDSSYDITQEISNGNFACDPEGLRNNASPAELVAICEKVQATVVSDDRAGTVTFNLAKPWGPFLATLVQPLGRILDSEWAIDNGAWDGSCDTWQNWYSPGYESSELSTVINGTGPYKLDQWTPEEEYVLKANTNYWRPDNLPMWENGPSGVPRIETIVIRNQFNWATRFAQLQAGDVSIVPVPADNRTEVEPFVGEVCNWQTLICSPNQANPDGPLRKWTMLPSSSGSMVFFNFDIANSDDGTNSHIGSGQLDGDGIPADFFSDVHVRRAFSYCFDYETYISEALDGQGERVNGPISKFMLGYDQDGQMYDFDLEKCEEELALAWGGVLPDTGFRFQGVYNTGNSSRQTAIEILATNLRSISFNYRIDVLGVDWPLLLREFRNGELPLVSSGWIEDIHDPHNWVQPFTVSTYANRQNLDSSIQNQFRELVTAGLNTAVPAEREQIYFELQRLYYDEAIQIPLPRATDTYYQQRWVKDWYYRPGQSGGYFYAFALE